MGSLRGFVTDEFQHPVENATIALPQIGDFALSHQDGSFLIEDVPNGSYTIHVIQRYYKPFAFKFDIYADMFVKGVVLKTIDGRPAGEPFIGGEREAISALEAKKGIEDTLMEIPGVVGVGLDRSFQFIRVYTTNCEEKLVKKIPREIAGFGVSVLCTGYIKALADIAGSPPGTGGFAPRSDYRARRYRPVIGGISAAHQYVQAGTLGAVVRRKSGEKVLLSNTHVFANRDMVGEKRAEEGDHILQPGAYDSTRLTAVGVTDNTVGYLRDWIKLDPYNSNIIDAAIAEPVDQAMAREFILANSANQLIRIRGIKSVTSSITVKKYSRTTDEVVGKVVDWDASVIVSYNGIPVKFTDQIILEMDAIPGDSGALILDMNNNAVGLLFGGAYQEGKQYVFANKIGNIFSLLDLKLGDQEDIKPAWSTGVIS